MAYPGFDLARNPEINGVTVWTSVLIGRIMQKIALREVNRLGLCPAEEIFRKRKNVDADTMLHV